MVLPSQTIKKLFVFVAINHFGFCVFDTTDPAFPEFVTAENLLFVSSRVKHFSEELLSKIENLITAALMLFIDVVKFLVTEYTFKVLDHETDA